MGERKVLNKYYPPDFDPARLPRGKRQERNEMKVRMMLPMSVRCKTCGNFMYKGTKFNTRKEDVQGDTYLGIQVHSACSLVSVNRCAFVLVLTLRCHLASWLVHLLLRAAITSDTQSFGPGSASAMNELISRQACTLQTGCRIDTGTRMPRYSYALVESTSSVLRCTHGLVQQRHRTLPSS